MSNQRTIAILSPGEMGSAVGRALHEAGVRVLTSLEGRSEASRERSDQAGFISRALTDLVQEADLVLAIVPPSAAQPLAHQVAAATQRAQAHPLYCDANSIGPATAEAIAATITSAGGQFVDGSIIGSAGGIGRRGTIYLSGPLAPEVGELLEPLHTAILGNEVGQASAFKVLYAGLTKGMSALGIELLAGAERLGIRQLLLDKYRSEHGDVARFFEHNLPELPPRAQRRSEEMLELTQTLEGLGLSAHTARASEATLASVGERHRAEAAPEDGDLEALLQWWVGR
jgi:3-hydroxyisobutyrate dehydrogenase-like beta-hydroxyacid dehydrogenase